jgi:hypothetical protein
MTDFILIKYSDIANRPNTSEDPLIPKEFQEKYEEALKRSKKSTVRKYGTTTEGKIKEIKNSRLVSLEIKTTIKPFTLIETYC